MPKDEFDPQDPLELNGAVLLTEQDTTEEMCECFIEEFMRLGYNGKQILALFRNPHYLGPNLAQEKRGEPFIRDLITEVFARWGRTVTWPESGASTVALEELRSLLDPQLGALLPDDGFRVMVAADPVVMGVEQPAVELGINQAGLGEMLPEREMGRLQQPAYR